MFSVVTPATNKKLTTLENLKIELGIPDADTSEDPKLNRLIDRLSAMICTYLGVPAASNGSVTLGLETLSETFNQSPWHRSWRQNTLLLARRPVTEIVSVNIGPLSSPTLIDAGDMELDPVAGILTRTGAVSIPGYTWTPGSRTIIVYKAGWTLPGATDFTLPLDIEGAVIGMIRSARFAAARDPAVKAEWTTDIERIEYWVGQIGENGAFPPDIASTLDPYCYEPAFG